MMTAATSFLGSNQKCVLRAPLQLCEPAERRPGMSTSLRKEPKLWVRRVHRIEHGAIQARSDGGVACLRQIICRLATAAFKEILDNYREVDEQRKKVAKVKKEIEKNPALRNDEMLKSLQPPIGTFDLKLTKKLPTTPAGGSATLARRSAQISRVCVCRIL
jgi:hypothetical protein